MSANVKNIDGILRTIAEITQVATNTASAASDAQRKAQELNSETEREERNSKQKLEQAKKAEKAAKQAHEAAKAGVVAAKAAVAVAAAAIPFSAAALATAQQALVAARALEKATYAAYQTAKAHRILMETRYKMAQACRMRAAAMLGKLISACASHVPKVADLTNRTASRLKVAKGDLDNFQSHIANGVNIVVPQSTPKTSTQKTIACESSSKNVTAKRNDKISSLDNAIGKQSEEYKKWRDYTVADDVVRPDKIRERLNPPDEVRMAILRDKYEKNPRFRQQVDDFRKKLASGDPQQIEYVKMQSKKNMAGQLGEDIIKEGLSPLADNVSTQVRQDLKDGSYTKIDITLEGLKKPIVFGKGEGMGAREGKSVAIEVKAGHEEYLRAQKPHLKKQVEGHKEYDVSLIMCTRDIKDMSAESNYREDIKNAGSRAIGMLPRKDDINDVVWRFLNEGVDGK